VAIGATERGRVVHAQLLDCLLQRIVLRRGLIGVVISCISRSGGSGNGRAVLRTTKVGYRRGPVPARWARAGDSSLSLIAKLGHGCWGELGVTAVCEAEIVERGELQIVGREGSGRVGRGSEGRPVIVVGLNRLTERGSGRSSGETRVGKPGIAEWRGTESGSETVLGWGE
jgi:hypothetical protein